MTKAREISVRIADLRRSIARRDSVGLTEIYNRFHDRESDAADIQDLRQGHEKLDSAIARAYEWPELNLHRDWQSSYIGTDDENDLSSEGDGEVWRYAISDESRELLLARLLELNAKRANDEANTPPPDSAASSTSVNKSRGRANGPANAALSGPGGLFERESE